jgi:hypothetical protein
MKKSSQHAQPAVTNFKMDWCSHEAAEYACRNYHYSKAIPAGKLVKIGVWEDDKFIGCVLFSRGANNHLLQPYGLSQFEGCELTRVALTEHKTPVTKIVSIAIKMLKKQSPNLKLIVSFADSRQKHLGIIYQAGNWIYTGAVKSTPDFFINGRWQHQRNVHSLYGTIKGVDAPRRDGGYRLRYLMPLTDELRKKIEPLRVAYPKTHETS